MAFTHLHVHTEYSLLDGSNKIKEYVARVKELGMNSAAITDHGVMYGVIDFYRAAREAGIKPILGCEVYVAPNSRFDKELTGGEDRYHHLVLLAENNTGYANLMKIVSRGFTEGYYYKPRVDMEVLQEFHEGIIALSACLAGEVPRFILKGMKDEARKAARKYEACFGKGNYFLELQDHGIPEQRTVNMELLQMSRELDIPLVTTNDVHYTYAEDAIPHDILLCLQTGKKLADDFLEAYIFADMPTLSVLDLRYVPELYAALESYWGSAYTALQSGSYGAFSQVRNNVREFGDNEYDQVDLSDLATLTKQSLSLGTEDDVQAAVQNMVVYNVTYEKSAAGIAVYFPCLWPDYYGDTRFEMTCVGFPESYFEFYDKFMNTMLSGQSLSQSDIDFYSYYDWFDSSEVGGENVTTINDNDFELIDKGDYYALSLSDEAWNLITYIDMTVYLDDGEGYIDLGNDNVYEFDDDGDLKVDFDYTWISIDGVIVPFYAETEEQTDDYWYTTGYVPAELNGNTDIEIVLRWDSDHDSGFVAGYRLKTEEPTVAAKGLHSFAETDQIQYTCSYYDYDFNYDRDYTLGDPVTYTSEPVVTYEEIGEYRTVIQYTLRDIYNNEHFTDPVELSCE